MRHILYRQLDNGCAALLLARLIPDVVGGLDIFKPATIWLQEGSVIIQLPYEGGWGGYTVWLQICNDEAGYTVWLQIRYLMKLHDNLPLMDLLQKMYYYQVTFFSGWVGLKKLITDLDMRNGYKGGVWF